MSRGPGHSLNGAGELYYEAVEGSQNPGGLLLSPAAFINPAQYASVLDGRFKQLQGERRAGERGGGGPGRGEGSQRGERGWQAGCASGVGAGSRCARGVITSGQEIRGCRQQGEAATHPPEGPVCAGVGVTARSPGKCSDHGGGRRAEQAAPGLQAGGLPEVPLRRSLAARACGVSGKERAGSPEAWEQACWRCPRSEGA